MERDVLRVVVMLSGVPDKWDAFFVRVNQVLVRLWARYQLLGSLLLAVRCSDGGWRRSGGRVVVRLHV